MKTLKSILMTLASLIGAATLSTAPARAQSTAPSAPPGGPVDTGNVAPKPVFKISPAVDKDVAKDVVGIGSLEVAAVDKCGRPVPGSHIEALPVNGSQPMSDTATDAKGMGKLTGLAAGTWFVAVYYGGGEFEWKLVEIKAGATAHLAIILPFDIMDINLDGSTDSIDFFDFLIAWANAEPAGDFNRDGAVNSQDFFDYMNAYLAGCYPPPPVAEVNHTTE